jgi:aspartate 1-decarboxylase
VASFCWMDEAEGRQFQPRVILVDERNRVTAGAGH